jgi:polynucleotide 5'-kinase involved in rRNA processing
MDTRTVVFLFCIYLIMNNTIQTSQKDPLKIVLCGPPHSGKSVFTQVLTNLLNKDRFAPIEAAPDGEGNT